MDGMLHLRCHTSTAAAVPLTPTTSHRRRGTTRRFRERAMTMADEKDPLMESSSDEGTTTSADVPKAAAAAAPFAAAVASTRRADRLLPQAIAHRGYKAAFAENTMAAFRGAVAVGAHALETDVRLSADGVAVLSHDASLKRCFGVDAAVAGCRWEYLSRLRTLRDPGEGMPRLRDLLAWMAGLGGDDDDDNDDGAKGSRRERVWVLLDIKIDDDAQDLFDAIATAIAQVPPGRIPWEQRIMLGCWNATTLLAAQRTLPALPLAHIGFSLAYARHFLPTPGLSFNLAHGALRAPFFGRRFMRDVRARGGRALFAWTVNAERGMEWCLRQNLPPQQPKTAGAVAGAGAGAAAAAGRLIDGVITDDPALFLAVCDRYEDVLDGRARRRRTSAREAAREAVGVVLRHLLFTLAFLHRRYVLGKLDYLNETTAHKKDG